ncbi:hypothetical protein GCM10023347_23040 [Streptomyces chumphonensis]
MTSRPGSRRRLSKLPTSRQTQDVLRAAKKSPLHAYIVVALLTGARSEELRPLTRDHTWTFSSPGSGCGRPAIEAGQANPKGEAQAE